MAIAAVLYLATVLVVENAEMRWFKTHYQHILALLGIAVVGIIVMWPLTHPGLFTAHDIWHQVARFYHYHASIEAGFWPPGWIMNLANGYGYPLFYFSYHLPWMVGELLLRVGFQIPEALKLLFGGAVVASGLTMYWFCWSVTKKILPSLAGAIAYIIAPYHFLTVYVAAAIGSVFQFVFVPLMFLGVYKIIVKKPAVSGVILLALGLAGSILSHLMSTVMILPFLALWTLLCLIAFDKRNGALWLRHTAKLIVAGLIAVLISAFYLAPLFTYKSAIIADSAGGFRSLYETNFVHLKQLIYSSWGFGPIISNAKDGEISMQVGIVQWLGVGGLALILLLSVGNTYFVPKSRQISKLYQLLQLKKVLDFKQDSRTSVLILILFTTTCLAMLDVSQSFWQFVNRYMTLDYPWRLLLLAVFFGSAAVALALSYIKPRFLKIIFILVLVSLAWYTNRNHIGVNMYTQIAVEDYVDAETTTNTFAEYLPRNATDGTMRKKHSFIIEPSAVSTISAQSAVSTSARVTVPSDGIYTLHHYDFPTLSVMVDERPATVSTNSDGLLQVLLTSGQHDLQIFVVKTTAVAYGTILSLVTIACLIGYILIRLIQNYAKN